MIAAGVAAGVFTSFTPFLGLHFIISWAIAFAIGGNLLAAAIGTGVGNPITFPFIWGATYTTGCFITGQEIVAGQAHELKHILMKDGFSFETLSIIWPTLKVMSVGAIPIGLFFAFIFYYLTRKAALAYQHRRKTVLARKAYEAGRWRKAIAEHDQAVS